MSDMTCATARELLPAYVGHRLPAEGVTGVETHLVTCEECRGESELVRMLYAGRRSAPAGLAQRVTAASVGRRGSERRPWWGLTAAAVAALALGIGITSEPGVQPEDLDVPAYAYEVEEGAVWVSDDGLLAGAPSLDVLSDEALEQLLDELSLGSSGGAA